MIGDPVTLVECDKCGCAEYFDMTPLAQKCWDNRHLASKMKRAHWLVEGDECFCPECAEEKEEV